jgi:hypothetical protein
VSKTTIGSIHAGAMERLLDLVTDRMISIEIRSEGEEEEFLDLSEARRFLCDLLDMSDVEYSRRAAERGQPKEATVRWMEKLREEAERGKRHRRKGS